MSVTSPRKLFVQNFTSRRHGNARYAADVTIRKSCGPVRVCPGRRGLARSQAHDFRIRTRRQGRARVRRRGSAVNDEFDDATRHRGNPVALGPFAAHDAERDDRR